MTSSKDKTFFLQRMSSICADHSSLKARVAQASLFGSSHKPIYEKSLLALEYLQLLSPILLSMTFFQNSQETSLPQTTLFLARLLNPAYWISFSELDGFKICILVFVFAFIAFKGLLLIWITCRLSRELPVPQLLFKIWRNLFKAQGRVIYYFITSILVNAIMKARLITRKDEEDRSKIMLAIFLFFVIAEFLFAMGFSFRYLYVLPTKSFLSSKDNAVEAITLLQKFIIQMLMIFVDLDSLSGLWVFFVINFSADIMRNFFFFKRLPLYSFKALAFQGRLLMIITSINIASFVSLIRKSADSDLVSLQMVIILWIFIGLFLIKLSEEYIRKSFWRVLSDPKLRDPFLLVHRISAIKQLRKLTKKAFDYNDNYAWSFLANKTLNENLREILKIDDAAGFQKESLDINSRSCADLMFKHYLEKLAESFPENQIIQLLMAQFKVKNFKIYGDAVRISKNIQKNGNSPFLVLNAELLLIEIQSIIHKNSSKENNPECPFDSLSFMKQQSLLAEIKLSMLEQAKLQIKICHEIKRDAPNLAFISDGSQELNNLKGRIFKKMNRFLQQEVSEQNLEPLLLNAQYHLALNHSFPDYARFVDQYIHKNQKSQKYFSQEALTQQNVFQNNVGYYLLSGQKSDAGNILFASKPGARALQDSNMQSGTNMAERAPPCLRSIYTDFYKRLSEDATDTYLNKTRRAFSYLREEDCLVEIEYNLSIHAYATQGFYYFMIFRQVESKRESMYVHENGDIEAATGGLKKRLSMKNNRCENSKPIYNIKDLSEELVIANRAFNQVAFAERRQEKTEKVEDEIYSSYSTTGRDLFLKPFHQESETYSYNVKIVNETYGPLLLKVFTFEENIKVNRLKNKQRISTRRKTTKTLTPHNLSTFGKEASPRSPRQIPTQPSEYYIPDDEKGAGWINIEALTSRKTSAMTRRDQAIGEGDSTSRCFLGSPALTKEEASQTFEDATREFDARGGRQKVKCSTDLMPDSGFSGLRAKQEGRSAEQRDEEEESYILSLNNSSTFSQKKKLANIYQASINSRHSPKIYKMACVLFFLMLIVFFIAEVLFLTVIDKNTQELKVKKDILRNFQYRNFISICIEGFIRIMWELSSGSLTMADVAIFPSYLGLVPYYYMASILLSSLSSANSELRLDASLLNEELNELLFKKDIPIYSTYFGESPQEHENLNTFQAIDMIVQAGFNIIKANGFQSDEVQEACRFIFRNNLNDVLVKNQIISDQLDALFDSQRYLIEDNIRCYYLFKGLAIFCVFAAFVFFIWRQYRKEEKNLSALCRINAERLNKVLKGCEKFKESIEEQTTLTHDFRFLLRKSEEEKGPKKGPAKRELSKVPDSQSLHKKYYSDVAKYFLLMAILGSLVAASSIAAEKNVSSFEKEQDQIYFIDFMRARTTLCFAASRELFNTNNTAKIENTIILDEYSALLTEFSSLRVEVYSTLLDSKTVSNNPLVETAILKDFCEVFSSSDIALPCQLLASYGIERNLIYLLGIFESTLKEQFENYVFSGKTDAELVEIRTNKIGLTLATFMLLVNMEGRLSGIINDGLNLEIEASHRDRITRFVIWTVMIFVVGILGWIWVLKRMKESVNNFKNVLKVLPGDVIFSSFILKTFLIKTTKDNVADLNKISRSMG